MPLNERVDIEVYGRKLTVEMDGITELEVHALAQQLTEKMRQIAQESQVVDSSKLAILVALDLAAELSRLQNQQDTLQYMNETKLSELIDTLKSTLG